MAEVMNQRGGRKRLVRVDLTPMVDLGFLLITFFVFTTELSARKAMPVFLPKDSTDSMQVAEGGALTLLLQGTQWGYYHGHNVAGTQWQPAPGRQAMRQLLLTKRQQVQQRWGNTDKLFVTIKPMPGSHLGDVVHALDEMTICQIQRYALAEASPEELAHLHPLP